jgi:hypothetical protein
MSRALSVTDVARYRPRVLPFEGEWLGSFGCPEPSGSWLIWGKSGNGKTRFALQLCRYLSQFGRVAYDSLEEGMSLTFKNAMSDVGMASAGRKFILLDKEPLRREGFTPQYQAEQVKKYLYGLAYDPATHGLAQGAAALIDSAQRHRRHKVSEVTCLLERLEHQKSPDVVVIDSLQYSGMTYADYRRLRDGFRRKLFIIVSHASGSEPAGRVAAQVKFDANVKVRVEGYKAFPMSRYGGGEPFIIWPEGAERYWGEGIKN